MSEIDISQFIKDIKKLPTWIKHYGLNHHSPSQLNKIDGAWSYEYLYLTQEQRRKLPGNSKMFAGVQMGSAGQMTIGDYEWHGTRKVEIKKHKNIFDKVLENFNAYLPVDEQDRSQHNINRKGLVLMYEQLKKAFKEVGLKAPVGCERTVSMNLPGCQLPCIGRMDYEDQDNFIELKTKWRFRKKGKKGTAPIYPLYGIKKEISPEFLLQVAFYSVASGKKPYLVIVNENSFIIFSALNTIFLDPGKREGKKEAEPKRITLPAAPELEPNNLKKIVSKMAMIALRRERLMERHAGKATFVQDIEPTFDHPYYWNFGGDHKQQAMKLWGIDT